MKTIHKFIFYWAIMWCVRYKIIKASLLYTNDLIYTKINHKKIMYENNQGFKSLLNGCGLIKQLWINGSN